MSTPISSNNPHGGIRQPTPAPTQMPNSAAVDQTAAEFAALLGAEPPPEQPRRVDDEESFSSERSGGSSETSGESRTESRGGEQRVSRKERRGGGDEEGSSSEDDAEPEAPPMPTFGDAILEGFSKVAGGLAVEQVPQPEGMPFDQVVQQICDKILVSDPGTGSREVRIILKESALPGTEIRLVQEAGKLQVQFVTDNADSQLKLQQHQATLQTMLNEKLGGQEVVVEVAMDAQGQDMGDGRSRQQRDAQEEYERQENA